MKLTIQRIQSRVCAVALLIFFTIGLHGQKHHLLPGRDDSELAKETIFCKPGVPNKSRGKGLEIRYGAHGSRKLESLSRSDDSGDFAGIAYSEELRAKIKIPLIHKNNLYLLAGYEYDQEIMHFDRIEGSHSGALQSLNNRMLRGNRFSLYVGKSFNEKHYGALRLRTAFDGDYRQWASFDDRYASYSGLALFGIKPKNDKEWGVGISFSHNPIRTRVLPFMIYNQTFNDKWGVEFVLPVQLHGRYNFSPTNLILFGAEYESTSYSVDLAGNSPASSLANADQYEYFIRSNAVNLQVSWEKNLFSWVWFNAQGGYQIPINSEFRNLDAKAPSFDTRQGGNPFLRVGLFLSPTKLCED
jgi:hypothetical protein